MFSHLKLGLKDHDPARVAAVKALTPDHVQDPLLSRVPQDWALGRAWDDDVLGNDVKGNCFPVSVVNWLKMMAVASGRPNLVFDEDDADELYEGLGWNGVIGSPSDEGVVLLDGMEYWTRHPVGGFQLDCFFRIGYADPTHLATALGFAPLIVGAGLTQACMKTDTWDSKVIDSPKKGGHAFLYFSDSPGGGSGKTWGQVAFNTPEFRSAQWWEAYLPVCQELMGLSDAQLLRLLTIAKEL